MPEQGKIKKQKKQANKNYRLAVVEENSYQEKFALSLSKRNIFLISFSVAFIIILITTLLIFYTPIREYIPGYDTTKLRIQAVQNLEKLDSIMNSLEKNEQFIQAFSRTINGEEFANQYEDSKIKEVDKKADTFLFDTVHKYQAEEKKKDAIKKKLHKVRIKVK